MTSVSIKNKYLLPLTDPHDAVFQAHGVVVYTDVYGQCDKLVTEIVISLPN